MTETTESTDPPAPRLRRWRLGSAPPHLRGWFAKTRRHRWLKLFLFEFFVVLLGVLAASGLQQHFERRAAEQRADDAIQSLHSELATLGYGAELRLRNYACTVYRLEQMERRVRGESFPVEHQTYHPPDPALVTFPGWGSDTIGAMRRYLSEEELRDIAVVGEIADRIEHLQEVERHAESQRGENAQEHAVGGPCPATPLRWKGPRRGGRTGRGSCGTCPGLPRRHP